MWGLGFDAVGFRHICVRGLKGQPRVRIPRPLGGPKKQNPQIVPYTGSFLGILKGIYLLDPPRSLGFRV